MSLVLVLLDAKSLAEQTSLSRSCSSSTRTHSWWPGGDRVPDPTSPRLSPVVETPGLGRVAQVSDESDLPPSPSTDDVDQDVDEDVDQDVDQAAAIESAMAEARSRLTEVPAAVVVTNHVMGLYELGAIHLSAETPDLAAAALAIDSMALLVDGLGERLGDEAQTMRDALANIRMAYVSVKSSAGQAAADD